MQMVHKIRLSNLKKNMVKLFYAAMHELMDGQLALLPTRD